MTRHVTCFVPVLEPKSGQVGNETHWVQKASLVDSRMSINDIKFAPRHLGLWLATCSSDGMLRVYEAPDVMNLSQWPLMVRDDRESEGKIIYGTCNYDQINWLPISVDLSL
jgi:hypothetical protein